MRPGKLLRGDPVGLPLDLSPVGCLVRHPEAVPPKGIRRPQIAPRLLEQPGILFVRRDQIAAQRGKLLLIPAVSEPDNPLHRAGITRLDRVGPGGVDDRKSIPESRFKQHGRQRIENPADLLSGLFGGLGETHDQRRSFGACSPLEQPDPRETVRVGKQRQP